jgi:hypothetical protein
LKGIFFLIFRTFLSIQFETYQGSAIHYASSATPISLSTTSYCGNAKKLRTSRLRYAGHMIRIPKDLPQKTLFRAKPNGKRNQGRPKFRWANGVNSDSLALRVRDCMHCAQYRQTWRNFLQQALRPSSN